MSAGVAEKKRAIQTDAAAAQPSRARTPLRDGNGFDARDGAQAIDHAVVGREALRPAGKTLAVHVEDQELSWPACRGRGART